MKYILLVSYLLVSSALAQSHPFEELRGLQRFDLSHSLSPTVSSKTMLDIKGVTIGGNVLRQSINLANQGGKIGRIRGGSRSHKVKFHFSQPHQDTTVNQVVELYFDKTKGFINKVTTTYRLENAYTPIDSLREQTLQAAINKYGDPLSLQQVEQLSGQQTGKGEVKLSTFIQGLNKNHALASLSLGYWQQLNISRSAKWVADAKGLALLNSGFDRCYLWQQQDFNQLLSFCFFDQSGGNASSRGIELNLLDFTVSQQIIEFNASTESNKITL